MKEKDVRHILTNFRERFMVDAERFFGAKPRIELVITQENDELLIINGKPLLARTDDTLFPTLIFNDFFPFLPKIVVDMGAIPYVCNGADVMAPGVVKILGEFDDKELLLIIDERYKRALAMGVSLYDSQSLKTIKREKIVKNIHYIGDRLWNTIKSFI